MDAFLKKQLNVLLFSSIWFGYQLLLGKMFKNYENDLDLRNSRIA